MMYLRPAGVVHSSTPGDGWQSFQPEVCLTWWWVLHSGAKLHWHVLPP